jgi:hypothetical protein
MKKMIALTLAMAFLALAAPAMADFTVRVYMEEDTSKGRRLWPKPLGEFQVSGNELTTREFDKQMYHILQRGLVAKQETDALRMEVSFMADGDFKFVSEDYMPDVSFFEKIGLSILKKHYGQIIWYSRNGEPWVEVASNERLRKIRKEFEIFHDGGRVDLRTYFTAGKDVGFRIESAGPLVAIDMEESELKPVTVDTSAFINGFSQKTQYYTYNLQKEQYIDKKPYAERNVQFLEAPPVFTAPNLSEADPRWTAYQVVHFGLVVDAPGFVQLAYMPNQSNRGSWSEDKERLDKSFFVANQGGDWKFLASKHIGHGKWVVFNAPKPGIYEVALYIEREEFRKDGAATGSIGGSFIYQAPYSNSFRPLELRDVVQIGSAEDVVVEEGCTSATRRSRVEVRNESRILHVSVVLLTIA